MTIAIIAGCLFAFLFLQGFVLFLFYLLFKPIYQLKVGLGKPFAMSRIKRYL